MIVEQLRLHPFAGTMDTTVRFGPGLNVVLGPNEAGKTTLANALRRVLFAHLPFTQTRFRAEIEPFLPVTGGDTVRVSLDFLIAGKKFRLLREWAAPRNLHSRLQLETGAVLTEPDAVEKMVQEALSVTEGTYDNVLSVTQSQLATTLARLTEDVKGSSGAFADVLRRSLYQSDGVAVDRLVKNVNAQVKESFGRWDREKNRPEKGYDIDRPWEKGTGSIVEAYYAFRRAEVAFEKAKEYESGLDGFVAREKVLADKCEGLERFIAEHESSVGDARQRSELSRVLKEKQKEAAELRTILDRWPRAEEQLALLSQSIASLLERHAALSAEFKDAQERLRQQSLREQFSKAEALQTRLNEEERSLAALKPVTDVHIDRLQKDAQKLQQVEIKAAARALALRLAVLAPLDVQVEHDGSVESVSLKAGEEYSTVAGGRFSVRHRDWTLDVRSPGDETEALEEERQKLRQRIAQQLAAINLGSIDEALAARRAYLDQSARLEQAKAGLSAILETGSFEALSLQVKGFKQIAAGRTPEEINRELVAVVGEGEAKRAEQKKVREQCDEWKRNYTSPDELLSLYTTSKVEEQTAQAALAQAKPIPPEFPDAETFVRAFESAQGEHRTAERALYDLRLERKTFEKGEPAESRRDLEELVTSTREAFEKALARGNAYRRIEGELMRLLAVLDTDIFTAYHRRVEELVAQMTSNRYKTLEMNGSLPQRVNSDERRLGVDHLSLGTLDVLAMAIRLAMAEGYVQSGDGFLLMDDPLVNLDPVRQSAVAKILRKFSSSRQVVILTCHPLHAELLGGQKIDFGGHR